MKYVIVGGVAGGGSAAARLRRLDEKAEIIIIEKSSHVSFSNCAMPFYLSGMVKEMDSLILMNPEKFSKQYHIDARVGEEVIAIDREEKKVTVKKLETGEIYEESYDRLILCPGARPLRPSSLRGLDGPHVFTIRHVEDIASLKWRIDETSCQRAVVIGGGFIGIEVAENLVSAGLSVTVCEAASQILFPLDEDMVQILHKELMDHEVNLILNDSVKEVTDHSVILMSGREISCGLVILAIGIRPDTELAEKAGLKLGETGAIAVDSTGRTSDPFIYAAGDAVEVHHALSHRFTKLSLAGPAQQEARRAASAICGSPLRNPGVIGSFSIQVFDYHAAATGLNEKTARAAGIPCDTVTVIPFDRVSIMPGSCPLFFKLIYEKVTGKLLGAQCISKGDAERRVDVAVALISKGGTLEDARDVELCYMPLTGTAKDAVNLAGMAGMNLLQGVYRQVPVSRVRALVEEGACIVDVRERGEYERGHLKGSLNIPLSELRERMDEIPQDQPVYLHCRSGQRSYYAIRALQGRGYRNLYNISGSFLFLSFYECFRDSTLGRIPIVTAYNFN
ncbi:FAD-dependent oxidoreductase [uncultured Dialister sp.]|uniref:FAD-dependent oxidoreductase n=1 Tax=uncultured Dialister sp. TaxID=278064 RepID=UPI00260AAB6E|nr:FAD-dependent oxidoreductase [uncultured Dialister sp.]